MAFEDFRKSILKVTKKRHHRIKGSLGVRDAFRWCRKEKWYRENIKPTEAQFYAIIRTVNELMAEELKEGRDVQFPQKMGQLEVRKYETFVKLVNGKVKTNRGVDWNATLKLWFEDEEAKENKTLVKVEDKEVFIIFYNRVIANFINKTLCQFKPNRELALAVRKAGLEGKIDAYSIGKDYD